MLAEEIQAVPGGEGKTLVSGTDDAPLVLEAAYMLDVDLDLASSRTSSGIFHWAMTWPQVV